MRELPFSGASGALALVPAPFLYYRGFSLRETAGAAASLVIYDNATAASGPILDEVSLIAAESARENYGIAKIAKAGLYIQVVAGTVTGSIFVD